MSPTPPAGFRFYTPMSVRYGDMDTLGHVNNAKYLTYIEQARIAYFHENHLWDGSVSNLGVIVAKISIDYKLPLTMQDGIVDIWTRCSRLGSKSFDLENVIITRRSGESAVAASATVVLVVFDYRANATVVMPDAWRETLLAYEPDLRI
jgi:acyl-CoA thioester hydrolase